MNELWNELISKKRLNSSPVSEPKSTEVGAHCLKGQCNRFRDMKCSCPKENCFHRKAKEPSRQEG